jgi:hypothetical protein
VVIRARYVKMSQFGRKVAALKYVEQDGVEKDGSRGVLYDADGSVDFCQLRGTSTRIRERPGEHPRWDYLTHL